MRMLRQYIRQLGEAINDTEAAIRLDIERNCRKLSLSKHMELLFKNDRTIKRRFRKMEKDNNQL